MSNTFVTPKAVSTIAQSRIDYNQSVTSLLDNFASIGAPGPASISLEGTAGLRTGMLWYKSGTDTADGQGRLFVYNGNEFTRNGLNTYKVSSISVANSAVSAGALEYGELVLVGTDTLYIVNSSNTGVIPLSVGTASNSELLDGLDSSQFLRSDQDDSTSGKLTVSSNLSVSQNIGVGIANPIYPLQIARDSIVVKLNDTNGTVGGSLDSYISFDASGTLQGALGYANTVDGVLSVQNRQGNVMISADSNNLKAGSVISLQVDGSTKMIVSDSSTTVNGDLIIPDKIVHSSDSDTSIRFLSSDTVTIETNSAERLRVASDGNVGIGTTSAAYKLQVTGTVAATDFNSTSDLALKTDITQIEGALDKVRQISGYTFTYKSSEQRSAGVIAQEIEKILPEAVSGEEGSKTVAYGNLVALLIEAIKEQQQQIESLKRG